MESGTRELRQGIVCYCTRCCKESMRIFSKHSDKEVAYVGYRERGGGVIFKIGYDQKLIVRNDGRLEIQERKEAPPMCSDDNQTGRYGNLWATIQVLPEGDYYGVNQDGQRVESLDGESLGMF